MMRLSCEKLPVLLTCLMAHLVWGEGLPPAARVLVRLNARLSTLFQRVSALLQKGGASLRNLVMVVNEGGGYTVVVSISVSEGHIPGPIFKRSTSSTSTPAIYRGVAQVSMFEVVMFPVQG